MIQLCHPGSEEMLTFLEALNNILEQVLPLPVQRIPLDSISGFVLAEPVIANFDMPLFDNSAVDGFGVFLADTENAGEATPKSLHLQGVIQAGDKSIQDLKPGQTLKILTGAPVPSNVEAVVMREYCDENNGSIAVKQKAHAGMNIRRQGEEYKSGQQILAAGAIASPSVVGLLATVGYSSFPAYKMPRVSVISTGNELVKPGETLKPGQIYDSNSYALVSALKAMGIAGAEKLHANDDADSTRRTLTKALGTADVVISCGGVSVGDFDFIKDIAEEIGVKTVFWKIAIKPGKPVYFGIVDEPGSATRKLLFGLPGNPVSALVTFHQLVKPALAKMIGLNPSTLYFSAVLKQEIKKQAGRMEFVRGTLFDDNGQLSVTPQRGQESHMMGGIAQANCLIHFPLELSVLQAGQSVRVELLNWSLT